MLNEEYKARLKVARRSRKNIALDVEAPERINLFAKTVSEKLASTFLRDYHCVAIASPSATSARFNPYWLELRRDVPAAHRDEFAELTMLVDASVLRCFGNAIKDAAFGTCLLINFEVWVEVIDGFARIHVPVSLG